MLPILSKETSTGWSRLLSSFFFQRNPLKRIIFFFRSLRRRNFRTFSWKQQCWQNCIVHVHENNFDVILHKQVVISGVFFRILADNLKYSRKQNCAALLILHSAHWEEQFSFKTFSENFENYDFFQPLIQNFWQGCKNCLLRVQRNKTDVIFWTWLLIPEVFSGTWAGIFEFSSERNAKIRWNCTLPVEKNSSVSKRIHEKHIRQKISTVETKSFDMVVKNEFYVEGGCLG